MTASPQEREESGDASDAREDESTERDASSDPSADEQDQTPEEGDESADEERPRRRWPRRLAIAAGVLVALGVAGWIAVHHVPGFGPWLANTLRSLFGNEFVARLEDTVYAGEDWVNRQTRSEEPPEALWEVPSSPPPVASTSASASASAAPTGPPPFRLADVGPMFDSVATEGDGKWVPFTEPRHPDEGGYGLKTYLHPDDQRSWSVVAIVAFDLKRIELHPVVGRHEPESKTPEAKDYERKAVIPKDHWPELVAAFNGGYKSTHGDFGMHVDGVTITPPRPLACVVAEMDDGGLLIRDWDQVKDRRPEMTWFRQTPICMYDQGTPHPALSVKSVTWGASSVSKTTVIRRSAIGLDEAREVLFVGIGDHVTGKAIAEAMVHAGAHSVAQLDVNFSFPKFVTYDWADEAHTELKAIPLSDHFEFEPDQYVGTPSGRDFFYVTRRDVPY